MEVSLFLDLPLRIILSDCSGSAVVGFTEGRYEVIKSTLELWEKDGSRHTIALVQETMTEMMYDLWVHASNNAIRWKGIRVSRNEDPNKNQPINLNKTSPFTTKAVTNVPKPPQEWKYPGRKSTANSISNIPPVAGVVKTSDVPGWKCNSACFLLKLDGAESLDDIEYDNIVAKDLSDVSLDLSFMEDIKSRINFCVVTATGIYSGDHGDSETGRSISGRLLVGSWLGLPCNNANGATFNKQMQYLTQMLQFAEEIRRNEHCDAVLIGGDFSLEPEFAKLVLEELKEETEMGEVHVYKQPDWRPKLTDFIITWPRRCFPVVTGKAETFLNVSSNAPKSPRKNTQTDFSRTKSPRYTQEETMATKSVQDKKLFDHAPIKYDLTVRFTSDSNTTKSEGKSKRKRNKSAGSTSSDVSNLPTKVHNLTNEVNNLKLEIKKIKDSQKI